MLAFSLPFVGVSSFDASYMPFTTGSLLYVTCPHVWIELDDAAVNRVIIVIMLSEKNKNKKKRSVGHSKHLLNLVKSVGSRTNYSIQHVVISPEMVRVGNLKNFLDLEK